MFRLFGVVRRMAVQTTYIVAGVRRLCEGTLLMRLAMTAQAAGSSVLPGEVLEADDFVDIAATGHVRRARPVAGFATMPVLQRRLEMGRSCKFLLVHILVAGLTGIGAHVLCSLRLRARSLTLRPDAGRRGDQNQDEPHYRVDSNKQEPDPDSGLLHIALSRASNNFVFVKSGDLPTLSRDE